MKTTKTRLVLWGSVWCSMLASFVPAGAAEAVAKRATTVAQPTTGVTTEEDSTPVNFEQKKLAVKSRVETWEARVNKKLEKLNQLAQTDLHPLKTQRVAVDEARELLTEMDQEASAILQAWDESQTDLRMYRQALAQAPAIFERIGNELEKKAETVHSRELAGAYADFAGSARKLAASYVDRSKHMDGLELKLVDWTKFVAESRQFSRDVGALLDAIPATAEGVKIEALVDRINRYIEKYRAMLDSLKGVCDKIGESSSERGKQQSVSPTAANIRTTKLHDYSKRLGAIGK